MNRTLVSEKIIFRYIFIQWLDFYQQDGDELFHKFYLPFPGMLIFTGVHTASKNSVNNCTLSYQSSLEGIKVHTSDTERLRLEVFALGE